MVKPSGPSITDWEHLTWLSMFMGTWFLHHISIFAQRAKELNSEGDFRNLNFNIFDSDSYMNTSVAQHCFELSKLLS